MGEDSYTEVTNESWFGRIKNAVFGVLFGFVLIAVSVCLLFWNEGRTVKRYKSLKEGAGAVISIESDQVLQENEGKLVHLSGLATTDEVLLDSQFQVSSNALSLKRMVKMYQWDETSTSKKRKKLGGGEETVTTYEYSKVWSSSVIHSSGFKKPGSHQNPNRMMFESTTTRARDVRLGAFTLSGSLVNEIDSYEPLETSDVNQMPQIGRSIEKTYDGFYIGNNEHSPEIGDLKITFSHVLPTTVSIVSKQRGNSFVPYVTRVGGSIEELVFGVETAETILSKAQSENTLFAWLLRLGGFVLMMIGFAMLFKPLSVIADIVPFAGNIVEFGTGILSFLLSLMVSLTTIAIAWIFYRPLLGGTLIVVAVAVLIMGLRSGKGKSKKDPGVKPPLSGNRKHIDRDSEDAFEFDNDIASSSKDSTATDPFLTED